MSRRGNLQTDEPDHLRGGISFHHYCTSPLGGQCRRQNDAAKEYRIEKCGVVHRAIFNAIGWFEVVLPSIARTCSQLFYCVVIIWQVGAIDDSGRRLVIYTFHVFFVNAGSGVNVVSSESTLQLSCLAVCLFACMIELLAKRYKNLKPLGFTSWGHPQLAAKGSGQPSIVLWGKKDPHSDGIADIDLSYNQADEVLCSTT